MEIEASDTTIFNDNLVFNKSTTQQNDANGMLKYMVKIQCGSLANSRRIISHYNGTLTSGDVTITSTGAGLCNLHFPTDISERYWNSSMYRTTISATLSCKLNGTQTLECEMRKGSDDSIVGGYANILVY